MAYEILIGEVAAEEIESLRAFDQRRIISAIEEKLSQQPTQPSRNRKCLAGLVPRFEHVLPIWELRVGQFRVFYDVNEAEKRVYVRSVRRKEADQTTEGIV